MTRLPFHGNVEIIVDICQQFISYKINGLNFSTFVEELFYDTCRKIVYLDARR